jgi:predicted short-subunit dehydrogenase-like oxidoreductase (DUF2520 family)
MKKRQQNREKISFIGAGRLGWALADIFYNKDIIISSVIDKEDKKARQCLKNCEARISSATLNDIGSETTILFLTVPDDEIGHVCSNLIQTDILRPGMIVTHASGLLSSDVLTPLRRDGLHICSFHPCFSFPENFSGDINGIYIALEGDSEGCRRLEALVRKIGGKPFFLSREDKPLYHAGCTMASNYFVSLMGLVQDVVREISPNDEIRHILPLVRGTLNNIEQSGVEAALTGPILRGDIRTVESHMNALKDKNPQILSTYIILGRATLRMAEKLGLKPEKVRALDNLFQRFHGND